MPASTLQDVADRAGVHRSTVALALRDHPRISEPMRRRIQAIARQLDYRINPLVSALMQSRRTNRKVRHLTLAYVTNYPTRYGWKPESHNRPDFFPGAAERAKDFGYRLEHFWLAEPGMTPQRFCDILTVRGIHGLIVGRLPPGQSALELAWERFSCVAVGLTLRSPLLHHVAENHFDTSWRSMQECFERGYKRVGFVFSEANDSPRVGDRWMSAYIGQQQKFPAEDRLPICPEIPASFKAFAAWFRKERPDALIVDHAPAVIGWLKELGKKVPEDVGVAELQDTPKFGASGMYYEPAKVGALAIDMVIGMLHRNETGIPQDHHEILLSGVWREGNTLPRKNAKRLARA